MSGNSRAAKKRSKSLMKKSVAPSLGLVSTSSSENGNLHQMLSQNEGQSRNANKRKEVQQGGGGAPAKVPRLRVEDAEGERSSSSDGNQINFVLCAGASLKDILDLSEVSEIDAKTRASILLNWMTTTEQTPTVDNNEFYTEYWESKPLVVERRARGKFKTLLTRKKIDRLIEEHSHVHGVDVLISGTASVASSTGNSDDQQIEYAKPQEVWHSLAAGCTIRLLQPQKHVDSIWHLCSALEHEFGCRVGCEVDLTPTVTVGSTGSGYGVQTAVEDCFFLCLAGRQRWLLYAPGIGAELPVYVEPPQTEAGVVATLKAGKPTLDCVLHAGDSLYLPRGWAYSCRAATLGDKDKGKEKDETPVAIHARIFTNASNSMADYLDLILPTALHAAADETLSLRRSLPRQYTAFLGIAHSENDEEPKRRAFLASLKKALNTVMDRSIDLCDAGAELLHKRFTAERLPVPLSSKEEAHTAPSNTIYPFTRLRMLRPGIACCVVEDGQCVVYHCMDNSRELFGNPLRPLEFELDDGPTIEALLQAYPESVMISSLPHVSEEIEDKVEVALALYKEGFLIIDDEASQPPQNSPDDNDDDPF